MKIEQIDAGRLRIRQFNSDDVQHCRRFRHDVFGLDEGAATAQSWLRWTIDSYRELANLGQPPYADYAVVLKDGGAFVGSVGIVPTVVPDLAQNRVGSMCRCDDPKIGSPVPPTA